MTTSTRWIATFDEEVGQLDIYSSNGPGPMYTWRRRQDLTHAIQTLILWSWERPANGWRTAPQWERLGESDVLVADAWPVRISVEGR
ncbi:hypothetical protein ACO0M4_23865 [Streptomyces sp. RGM 3693]|uniref:hypothetical protein n=1 Tax=Streptomyces sp. RGM 3693 TaxID=3413284 RepID=UPI003D266902